MHLIAVDGERCGKAIADLAGQHLDATHVGNIVLQHRELVAAETGDQIGFAHAAPETIGDRPQQRVADRMSQRVIDFLEVVEIEIVDGEQAGERGPAAAVR